MRIELNKSELLFDIRNKSHAETASITDAESRYRVEAGTEKTDELERNIITSLSMLFQISGRYLRTDMSCFADNGAGLPDVLVFDFSFTERRMDGKAQPLADAMHAFIVENSLALFYESVAQNEFQTKHSQAAAINSLLVEKLIFTKKPPYMTR